MPDNVFEKLDRIEGKVEILASQQKNEQNKVTLDSVSREDLISFVQKSKRYFQFRGDKSELKRRNARNKKRVIVLAISGVMSLFGFAVSGFCLSFIAGIITTIVGMLLFGSFALDAIKFRNFEYVIPYENWFVKGKVYIYDDNDISYGPVELKWYYRIRNALAGSINYLFAMACSALCFIGKQEIIGIIVFVVMFVLTIIMTVFIHKKETYPYELFFESDSMKIAYPRIKTFMTENGLK